MPIRPKDFSDFATRMFRDPNYNSEAAWRTVIGRQYYSAYLEIRDLLKDVFGKFDKHLFQAYMRKYSRGKMHFIILKILKELNPIRGQKFERLQQLRKFSDYKPEEPITKDQAKTSIFLRGILLRNIEKDILKIFKSSKKKRAIQKILEK
ncbi:MAG: hypothetical protein ACP6IP_10895 [Candidatus Njordarchaeia archaeon]